MTELLLVSEIPEARSGARSFGVRVHAGVLTLGRCRCLVNDIDGNATSMDIECEQIETFRGVLVDRLESNHGGRVTFVGVDVHRLEVDQSLALTEDD